MINTESKVIRNMRTAKVLWRQDAHGKSITYLVNQTPFATLSEAGKFNNPFFGSFLRNNEFRNRKGNDKKEAVADYYVEQYKGSAASYQASISPNGFLEFPVIIEDAESPTDTEEGVVRFYTDRAVTIMQGQEIPLRGGAVNFGSIETREEATLRAQIRRQTMQERIYGEFGKEAPKEFATVGAPAPVKKQIDDGADLIY